MPKFKFQGGEIVRLQRDLDGVEAGCCGVVWGVYESDPPFYEASFVNESGEIDIMFEEQDVEEVEDIQLATFANQLAEIRELLEATRKTK